MKSTTKTTISLSKAEVEKIIMAHFSAAGNVSSHVGAPQVQFNVSSVGDDRYGGYASYGLTSVDVTIELDSEKLAKLLRGQS